MSEKKYQSTNMRIRPDLFEYIKKWKDITRMPMVVFVEQGIELMVKQIERDNPVIHRAIKGE